MTKNICRFVPFRNDTNSIHTINFVLETEPQNYEHLRSESVYKMHYVCSGEGFIHTCGKISRLSKGDIFFTFPASSFAIESVEDFKYMYISFVGLRGNSIMENLKINCKNFIFSDATEVQEFWKKGISISTNAADLISESVLLYTFSFLMNKYAIENNKPKKHSSDCIKKYIDEHFTDHNFSLENISIELSYNKKYISYMFKKQFGIGVIEYLNTVRIQNACTMMEQGFTSISDISDRCGYSDAQYFSKLFKQKMGVSPTQYIGNI